MHARFVVVNTDVQCFTAPLAHATCTECLSGMQEWCRVVSVSVCVCVCVCVTGRGDDPRSRGLRQQAPGIWCHLPLHTHTHQGPRTLHLIRPVDHLLPHRHRTRLSHKRRHPLPGHTIRVHGITLFKVKQQCVGWEQCE